jgi:tetratricopeptide (TPR) repeat protein
MTGNSPRRGYNPAFRLISVGVPLAAIAAIAALLIFPGGREPGSMIEIKPPLSAGIPYVGFAEIDTTIAGGAEAFEEGDYDEAARLLSRARFFIHSGIMEGRFDRFPRNLELILGLSEFLRGYPPKGIEFVASAAETNPENETYSWYLGLMYLSQGSRDEAKKYLQRTAALDGIYSQSAVKILEEM